MTGVILFAILVQVGLAVARFLGSILHPRTQRPVGGIPCIGKVVAEQ